MNSSQQPNKCAIAAFFLFWGCALPARGQLFPDRPTFFEEGNRQLEREIQTLQESAPNHSVLTINSGQLQWQKFLFREGNFSIWMPTGEISQQGREIPTSIGMLVFTELSVEQSASRFLVSYSQPLRSLFTDTPEVLFAELRDRFVADTGMTLTRETEISFTDYPGRELMGIEGEETIVLRFYQVRDRVYIFGVMGKNASDLFPAQQVFFDSLELL